MSVTITKPSTLGSTGATFVIGNKRIAVRDCAFSGSYATGGEAIAPKDVGLRSIIAVLGVVTEGAGGTAALPQRWDATNSKLQVYESAAAGSAPAEKGAEAYAASTAGRLTFLGT